MNAALVDMSPSSIWYHMGHQNALEGLCALIQRDGLVPGVRSVVEHLAEVNPENPDIEPALEILNEADRNLIFVVEEDHVIMYAGAKFAEACNVIRGGNLVDVWRNGKSSLGAVVLLFAVLHLCLVLYSKRG